jgi:hypothetical protein
VRRMNSSKRELLVFTACLTPPPATDFNFHPIPPSHQQVRTLNVLEISHLNLPIKRKHRLQFRGALVASPRSAL